MNISKLFLVAAGSAMLFAAGAYAGNGNKGKLRLADSVSVEGKQLAPGTYSVEWEGNGPDVKLNIVQGRQTVATVPARVVAGAAVHQQNGYGSEKQTDGSILLTSIFFEGKKYNLEVASKDAAKTAETAATGQK
jgi:hypothetical protein